MALNVNATQRDFRAINDNGSESASTFLAALNTNWTQAQNANFRLRIAIVMSSGSGWTSTSTVKFQYNKNSAGWNDITSVSSVVQLSTSSFVTDETATTQRISSPDTFLAGNVLTSSTLTSAAVGSIAETMEVEACLKILSAGTTVGDTIQIRVVNNSGTAAAAYTNTPTITVSAGSTPAANGNFFQFFM